MNTVKQISGMLRHYPNVTSTTEVQKNCAECDIAIGGMKIHVKSVFNGQTTLHKALANIVLRKLSTQQNPGIGQ